MTLAGVAVCAVVCALGQTDPVEKTTGSSAAEGVAADIRGNIFGAEVSPKRVMKYVRQ